MSRLRVLRAAAGLTQGELASRAGVSRQLVGTVETGRHLPRVDAAIALADVLGVDVAALFADEEAAVDAVSGAVIPAGAVVRVGRVGDRLVTAPARLDLAGFDLADAVARDGGLERLGRGPGPGLVVAGCEPGLVLLERLLRETGAGSVAGNASTADAVAALVAGRLHAAVVHGPPEALPAVPVGLDVEVFHVSSWQVGLAARPDAVGSWWEPALRGEVAVVQRAPGAGVQAAFDRARSGEGHVPGRVAASHLEAARAAADAGDVAVTIEPAARALALSFHPLETHVARLWVDARHRATPPVQDALEVLVGRRFRRRLAQVGGYDLAHCGSAA